MERDIIVLIIGIVLGAFPMTALVYWQANNIKRLKKILFDIKNPNDRDINPFDDIPEPWDNEY